MAAGAAASFAEGTPVWVRDDAEVWRAGKVLACSEKELSVVLEPSKACDQGLKRPSSTGYGSEESEELTDVFANAQLVKPQASRRPSAMPSARISPAVGTPPAAPPSQSTLLA